MITQPIFLEPEFIRRFSQYTAFGASTSINSILTPHNVGHNSSFASYSSDRINILKSGKYRLILDFYCRGNFAYPSSKSGTAEYKFEKNGSADVAKLATSTTSGATTITTNNFQSMVYLNQGSTALAGTNIGSNLTNGITWEGRWFYSGELNLLASDYIHQRLIYSVNFADTATIGTDGYMKLIKLT